MKFVYDDYSDKDEIGHDFTRKALVNLIKQTPKDRRGSFTVGVYGEWGTGKTSMLRMMEKDFAADPSVETIWFNPWQFANDDNIIGAFFHVLAQQLVVIAAAAQSENATKSALAAFSEKAQRAASSISFKPGIDVAVPFIGKLKVGAETKSKSGDALSPEEIVARYANEATSTYYDLVRYLRDATENQPFRLVVFIDDLDRCDPAQAIDLLDGLKVLLDIPNFTFVLGVANNRMESAARSRFSLAESDDEEIASYLDKIIQFSFLLPRPDPKKVVTNIIMPALKLESEKAEYAHLILDVLGSNPRSVKRFLNSVAFANELSALRFSDKEPDFEKVLKSALIAFDAPDLHRALSKHPKALIDLENAIRCLDYETVTDIRESVSTGNPSIDRHIGNATAVKLVKILEGGKKASFGSVEDVADYLELSTESLKAPSSKAEIEDSKSRNESGASSARVDLAKIPVRSVIELAGVNQASEPASFFMSRNLVTQELYETVMGKNPSAFQDRLYPVERVSWLEAVQFCNQLSEQVGRQSCYVIREEDVLIDKDADGYRLPTEVEWEQALAGYNNLEERVAAEAGELAWFMSNSSAQTQAIGQKASTDDGVYDLLGNVWEWIWNWSPSAEETSAGFDAFGPENGHDKICKGGSWANFKNVLGTNKRAKHDPDTRENNIGFRVVTNTSN